MPTCTDIDVVIEVLEPILRTEIRKEFGPQSCIESCHVLHALLSDVGVHAEALAVETTVVNKAYLDRAMIEGPPADMAALEQWHRECGAGVVWIGARNWGLWPGHLVLLTDDVDGACLWDASIDQASRPQHAITLPELLVISELDLTGLKAGRAIEIQTADGVGLRYVKQPRAVPCDVSEFSPGDAAMQAVARVLERTREQLREISDLWRTDRVTRQAHHTDNKEG